MKTSDLIALLGNNVEPVDRNRLARVMAVAIPASAALALGAMIFLFGVRTDLASSAAIMVALKIFFTAGIVILTSVYLLRIARPGGDRKTSFRTIAVPFIGIALLAAISLGLAPETSWHGMTFGNHWQECFISIPIIAVIPFSILILALRYAGAPTDLVRAGAFAGLVAGAISATGYALHCSDDSVAFIALWYGGTIGLCALVGAYLGPRLLRW